MLSFLLIIAIAVAASFWITRQRQRLAWVQAQNLMYVEGAKDRYPHLPLGNYGIPLRVKPSSGGDRVEMVFPRLTADGDVEYIYSWHYLRHVWFPTAKPEWTATLDYQLASEIGPAIRDHLQAEQEVEELRDEYAQLRQLARHVSTSQVYQGQLELYERALVQVADLMAKSEELRNTYVHLIREALIGAQLSNYDPSRLLDLKGTLERQLERLRDEFSTMKSVATAYEELTRAKRSLPDQFSD